MGPEVAILLPRLLSPAQKKSIDDVLDSLCSHREHGDSYWFCTTSAIGGDYDGEGVPFLVDFDYLPAVAPNELEAIRRVFGFLPEQGIAIAACEEGATSERILGRLALYLAETHGGSSISFCGALRLPVPAQFEPRFRPVGFEAYCQNVVIDMPGRLIAVRSIPDVVTHFADVDFLRAWVEHPAFHMAR